MEHPGGDAQLATGHKTQAQMSSLETGLGVVSNLDQDTGLNVDDNTQAGCEKHRQKRGLGRIHPRSRRTRRGHQDLRGCYFPYITCWEAADLYSREEKR